MERNRRGHHEHGRRRGGGITPFVVTAGVLFIGALIWSFLIDAEKPLIPLLPRGS
jgi:hypothetical protein